MDLYHNRFKEELESSVWKYETVERIQARTPPMVPRGTVQMLELVPELVEAQLLTPEEAFWLRTTRTKVPGTILGIIRGMYLVCNGSIPLTSFVPLHLINLYTFYAIQEIGEDDEKET